MTSYNIVLLLVAMIGAGMLGGAANYMLLHKVDPEYAKRSRSFVLALVAAFLAPLFLRAISSNIIDNISTIRYGSGLPFDFFVFAGFCLMSAMLSRTVAETVAKRLTAEVEKAQRESREALTRAACAEERASQTEPLLRQAMEEHTEPQPEFAPVGIFPSLQELPADYTDWELLTALQNGQYSYRTVNSLAAEVRLEDLDVSVRLERMHQHALVGKKAVSTRDLWFLTDKGCNWLEAHSGRAAAEALS